jgi:uncharacterized protein YjbI with pentapeptide repeats
VACFPTEPDKLGKVAVTRSFRGRNLTQADFNRSDLREFYFTRTKLNGAQLTLTKLQGARFECGSERKKYTVQQEGCAQAEGADFSGAAIQGVRFREAKLQGASSTERT